MDADDSLRPAEAVASCKDVVPSQSTQTWLPSAILKHLQQHARAQLLGDKAMNRNLPALAGCRDLTRFLPTNPTSIAKKRRPHIPTRILRDPSGLTTVDGIDRSTIATSLPRRSSPAAQPVCKNHLKEVQIRSASIRGTIESCSNRVSKAATTLSLRKVWDRADSFKAAEVALLDAADSLVNLEGDLHGGVVEPLTSLLAVQCIEQSFVLRDARREFVMWLSGVRKVSTSVRAHSDELAVSAAILNAQVNDLRGTNEEAQHRLVEKALQLSREESRMEGHIRPALTRIKATVAEQTMIESALICQSHLRQKRAKRIAELNRLEQHRHWRTKVVATMACTRTERRVDVVPSIAEASLKKVGIITKLAAGEDHFEFRRSVIRIQAQWRRQRDFTQFRCVRRRYRRHVINVELSNAVGHLFSVVCSRIADLEFSLRGRLSRFTTAFHAVDYDEQEASISMRLARISAQHAAECGFKLLVAMNAAERFRTIADHFHATSRRAWAMNAVRRLTAKWHRRKLSERLTCQENNVFEMVETQSETSLDHISLLKTPTYDLSCLSAIEPSSSPITVRDPSEHGDTFDADRRPATTEATLQVPPAPCPLNLELDDDQTSITSALGFHVPEMTSPPTLDLQGDENMQSSPVSTIQGRMMRCPVTLAFDRLLVWRGKIDPRWDQFTRLQHVERLIDSVRVRSESWVRKRALELINALSVHLRSVWKLSSTADFVKRLTSGTLPSLGYFPPRDAPLSVELRRAVALGWRAVHVKDLPFDFVRCGTCCCDAPSIVHYTLLALRGPSIDRDIALELYATLRHDSNSILLKTLRKAFAPRQPSPLLSFLTFVTGLLFDGNYGHVFAESSALDFRPTAAKATEFAERQRFLTCARALELLPVLFLVDENLIHKVASPRNKAVIPAGESSLSELFWCLRQILERPVFVGEPCVEMDRFFHVLAECHARQIHRLRTAHVTSVLFEAADRNCDGRLCRTEFQLAYCALEPRASNESVLAIYEQAVYEAQLPSLDYLSFGKTVQSIVDSIVESGAAGRFLCRESARFVSELWEE